MKNIAKFAWLLFSVLPAARMTAQESAPKAPQHFYRLVYQIEETDGTGKVTNGRSYTTTAVTGNSRGFPIKTGNKIPLHTNEKGDIQYIDVGVNILTQDVVEEAGKLHLVAEVEVSSLAEPNRAMADPVIRQNKWVAEVLVPVGKPAVIFSSDNLENRGKTQVELIATRME